MRGGRTVQKKATASRRYEEIPYASEQGIFLGINRELDGAIREYVTLIRES
jgi:hypothetical protein